MKTVSKRLTTVTREVVAHCPGFCWVYSSPQATLLINGQKLLLLLLFVYHIIINVNIRT